MRLLQLTSDNPKFRTLNFNKGLNIVVGTQLTEEQKLTINGIGKSLSLTLIHYMFGAKFKTSSEKRLREYLKNYGVFELTFSHKGQEYTIKKDFSKPAFFIDGEEKTQKDYPSELGRIFLEEKSPVTFKQLFNCFSRRYSVDNGMIYYSNALTQQGQGLGDYLQRFINLLLLKVDVSLVQKSYLIKERLSKLKEAEKTVKDYESALDKNNINDIKDEIVRLSDQLDKFIIAENFDTLKQEADDLTREINTFRNDIYLVTKKLKAKELNFSTSDNVDVDIEKITEIYNEANFFFEEKITKRLEQAQEFHNNLIANRKKRLSIEIQDLTIELEKLEQEVKQVSDKRDSILQDLNNSGALEERDSLKDRIKTLEEEQRDLEKYEHILNGFKKDQAELEVEESLIKKESLSYLEKNHEQFQKIEQVFRGLVKRFYDNSGGHFKIEEAPTARYLFNINTSIPKEGSQGVGEVKIFCYDVLLYLLNKDILGFLSHDGCIFAGMDPRQKSTIFKVIVELLQENELQYFLNVGDSTLNEVLDENNEIKILTDSERNFIKQGVILELSDRSPEEWLFGESFN